MPGSTDWNGHTQIIMSNRVERLVSEHWRQVCPANVALQPPVNEER